MEPSRNLVLVHSEGWQDVADFYAIKTLIEEAAPDIEVLIASNTIRSSATRKKASRRPTLVFSPICLLAFHPDRGKIYQGRQMSKLEEIRSLSAGGVSVPPFEEIKPETRLDPEFYGPFVLVKPSFALASWGQGVELRRTDTVKYRPPEDYPETHPGRWGPMIAQKFIDCGYAMTARVLTLFGAPLFTFVREATKPMQLDPNREFFEQQDYMPAPPDVRVYTSHDPDLLSFAAEAYRAMPEIALQACDILRDKNGDFHLIEINPGGGTWSFSNKSAPDYRLALQTDDLTREFDAFRTCAQVLIERTRAEAV
jgi:hypothetical protein